VKPLPRFMMVADVATAARPLPEIVASAVDHGARAVLLRARSLAAAARAELAAALRRVLDPADGLLIVAGTSDAAIHLSATQDFPAPRPSIVGRSCHNAHEVDRAVAEGCDYAFVSPVYATSSKPGYGPPLGPTGLAALCRPGLPIYALGGVMPKHVTECRHAGAHGIAAMGPVMRDPTVVAAYLAALTEVTG
jgi:thiamine-phosphate diphosphorylase